MGELVANPRGCPHFEQNVFKKEKCKHCGYSWQEHLGVIPEDVVQGFISARQQATAARQQKEAAEKAKALELKMQLKKQNQAVEDKWYFNVERDEDIPEATDSGEDNDGEFRMLDRTEVMIQHREPEGGSKPMMMLRNLIDFNECNVVNVGSEDIEDEDTEGTIPLPPVTSWVQENPINPPHMSLSEEELLMEIEHLRQMLVDTGEEKKIQVDIIREEAAEKQQQIDDLIIKYDLANAQVAENEQQIGDLAQKCNWAEAQLTERSQRIEDFTQRCAELEAKIVDRQQEVDDLTRKCAVMEDQAKLILERQQVGVQVTNMEKIQQPCTDAAIVRVKPAHTMSVDAATLILDLQVLCKRTRQALGDLTDIGPSGHNPSDCDVLLKELHEAVNAVHVAAVRADEERRHLARQLLAVTGRRHVLFGPKLVPTPTAAAMQNVDCPAVKMLQEVRLNAERQFVHASKRMHSSQEVQDAWRRSWWIKGIEPSQRSGV